MYLIPLHQIESVDLLLHALRAAGGEADCSACPIRKVCTKQCLSLADGIQQMVASGTLPSTCSQGSDHDPPPPEGSGGGAASSSRLRVVK
jgi:hypothetical protein